MRTAKQFGLAALMLAGVSAGPAVATPLLTFQQFIAVPADGANVQTGGAFSSFDISYFDPVTGNDYVADRSNASVDIFSGSSLTFLGRATGFTGQQSTTSASGADGVLTVTSGGVTTLYAGDGNSTLKVFNATNPAAPSLLQSLSTGGTTRVDEMAYAPTAKVLLAANNAETPAYGNLFSTTGPVSTPATLIKTPITVPAGQGGIAGGGMEQPAWNKNTGTFFVSIPQLAGTGNPGGLTEIDTAGNVLQTFDFGANGITSCSPAGLAVGGSGNMLVGCGNIGAAAILVNCASTGAHACSIVKSFPGLGGTDEIWYDPTTGEFYVTGNNGTNGTRFFDVVSDDAGGGIIVQSVSLPLTTSAHSIAVNSLNGDVFVPLAGTSAINPCGGVGIGCIAVYGVPEPELCRCWLPVRSGSWVSRCGAACAASDGEPPGVAKTVRGGDWFRPVALSRLGGMLQKPWSLRTRDCLPRSPQR